MTFTDLSALKADLENNFHSLPLVSQVIDIVHGEGDERARVMLIGEAPGYHETVLRRPFVGRSGQLLRATMSAVGLEPAATYISNIVKARPPDNRDPSTEEIAVFKPYLDEEIRLINPQLIITLGRFSMAKFLPEVKISQVHGRLHKVQWQGQQLFILPMYHPAAALRSTAMKTSFTQDFKKIDKILTWIKEQKQSSNMIEEVKEILF
jgi:DNA polymerase